MNAIALEPPVAPTSCWRAFQTCATAPRVVATVKVAFWLIAAAATWQIPMPGLNGCLTGPMLFMWGHSLLEYPRCTNQARPNAPRSWQQLLCGLTIASVGATLASLLAQQKNPNAALAGTLLCAFLTSAGSLGVAYWGACSADAPENPLN